MAIDPETLDYAVRNFVLHLTADKQPPAFRSLVRACTLNKSSSLGERSLAVEEECDQHGKLFLAAIFGYSITNRPTPAPMPAYLSVKSKADKHLSFGWGS